MKIREWTNIRASDVHQWAAKARWRRRLVVIVAVPPFLVLTLGEYLYDAARDWAWQWRDVWPDVKEFWRL